MREYLAYCYQLIDSASRLDFTWTEVFGGAAERRLAAFNEAMGYSGKLYQPSIYIIYDSAHQPIYVGTSKRIIERLKDHVGRGEFCRGKKCVTPAGRYIKANSPESHQWLIAILDLPDHLEQPAIWHLNPFLNTESKPQRPSATPVPAPTIPF